MRHFSPAQLAAQERFKRMVKSGAWPKRKRRPLGEALAARKASRAAAWERWRAAKVGRQTNPTLMVMNPGPPKHPRQSHFYMERVGVEQIRTPNLRRALADLDAETAIKGPKRSVFARRRIEAIRRMLVSAIARRPNPSIRRGVSKWIQSAIRRPGAFSAKARRAGMSTGGYARQVLRSSSRATTRTKRQAALARTLGRMRPNAGGRGLRTRAATALDLTHPIGERGPRTMAARAAWAKWLDLGGRPPSKESLLHLERAGATRLLPRGNPSVPSSALRMYRRFHGSDPMNVRRIDAPPGTPKHLVMLGKLTELGYRVPGHSGKAGRKNIPYLHKSGRGNILATDATGRNLFILKDRGSRMRVKSDGIND